MNLINKLLDNLEKCKDRCQLSLTVRTLNGENFCGCKGLTCEKCEEQANVLINELRKISIQQENDGWFPVKEDVTDKEVLCCNKQEIVMIGFLIKDRKSSTGYSVQNESNIVRDVVAWQPKTKPYKES